MPESGKAVLLYVLCIATYPNWYQCIGFYDGKNGVDIGSHSRDSFYLCDVWYEISFNDAAHVEDYIHGEVTHWMPLPESPDIE